MTSNIAQTSALVAGIFQVTSHAVLGGVSSALQGGKFGTGALSGAIGSIIGSSGSKYLANAGGFVKAVGTTLIGGLSGGVGSRLAGGKFWDGFRNGAISAGLNHAAHSLMQVDPAKLKSRILKDGRLTLREANKWWRHGNGEALTVDASKVDLDFVNPNDYKVGGDFENVQTLFSSRDGRVYGNIGIRRTKGNQFEIHPDVYNFDNHNGTSLGTWVRNQATNIGRWHAGSGQEFKIHFKGTNYISPKYWRRYNR